MSDDSPTCVTFCKAVLFSPEAVSVGPVGSGVLIERILVVHIDSQVAVTTHLLTVVVGGKVAGRIGTLAAHPGSTPYVLHGPNEYAKKFRRCVESVGDPSQLTQLRILFKQNTRPVYTRGEGAEVAILGEPLVDADNAYGCQLREGEVVKMSIEESCFDAMYHVMLLPSGDNEWARNMLFSTAAAQTPGSSAQHSVDDHTEVNLDQEVIYVHALCP
eukprot:6172658-Pleurochrysis_carterae.AAC.2